MFWSLRNITQTYIYIFESQYFMIRKIKSQKRSTNFFHTDSFIN